MPNDMDREGAPADRSGDAKAKVIPDPHCQIPETLDTTVM